jgi:kynurenine formamidase
MTRIVDLSLIMQSGFHGVDVEPRGTIAERDANTTTLRFFSHASTHMDAPYHFVQEGKTLEQVALEKCCGPALVIDLSALGPRAPITVDHLAPYAERIGPGTRLLLRTDWSTHADLPDYRTDYPRITLPLARWLAGRKIALLGVEPPSVADMSNREELIGVHQALLGAEIVIVEGLANLDKLQDLRQVTFIALPLKLEGGDGSPVRAIAIEAG